MTVHVMGDLHLGDEQILCRRPQFDSLREHDETIVSRWNSSVARDDLVYVLGDVAIDEAALHGVQRLNGQKHLILGNRDRLPIATYLTRFVSVAAATNIDIPGLGATVLFSHIPVHPSQLGARWPFNVHGHLHSRVVLLPDNGGPDHRYLNVSAERTDYRPVTLERLAVLLKQSSSRAGSPLK
jgi:calcineurin-like phosphoesterase family protein